MNKVPFVFFLFALIFAPLAFGTVEQWSLATLQIAVAIAYTTFFLSAWFYQRETVTVIGLLPLVLLLLFMVIQIIPLPEMVVSVLSPGTHAIYAPVLAVQEEKSWIPLSVNYRETLYELLRITCYALVYILTIQLLSSPARLKLTVNVVIFLASAIAFLAIIQAVSSPNKIYWFREVPSNASPFGPWINPNQFSGFMGMIFPLATALMLFYKPKVRSKESLREKVVSFFSEPGIHLHVFIGFSAVLIPLAVFVSLCRGGILSMLVAGVMFLFLYNVKFPKRSRLTLLIIILCVSVAVTWFGWEKILLEFDRSFDASGKLTDGRLTLWSDVLGIIRTFPIFGAGFGTFMSIYPLHKTIDDKLIYDHAHNDYLELFTDGGIIGFGLAAWFVVTILWHGWKMIRKRKDQYAILLGIGTISGITALLAHAITDFNLHNGAVGLYFFFLCGLLVASVNCRFNYFAPGTLLKKSAPNNKVGYAVVGIGVFLGTVILYSGSFWAGFHYKEISGIYVSKQLNESKLQRIMDNMRVAIAFDPFEGMYLYKLGSVMWYLGDKEWARKYHVSAGIKNPLEGIFLQQIGLHIADQQQGRMLIEEGYRRALNKDALVFNYVEWLLLKNLRQEAFAVLRNRMINDFWVVHKWMPLLNGYEFTNAEIIAILPESVEAWLHFGEYCEKNRTIEEAIQFYDGAMTKLSADKPLNPGWFMSIISFYQRQSDKNKVIKYIRQAVELIPHNAVFHIMLGDYYLAEGITYRAKEEYERALVLDPINAEAKSKLRRMGFQDSY